MNYLALILFASLAGAMQTEPLRPASQPASSPTNAEINALIKRLGATVYADREVAQARLTEMIDAGADVLLAHVRDADPEIATRVELILTSARGTDLRARIAVGLIETGNPELVARATEMMFQDGSEALKPFRQAAARDGRARTALAAPIILGELESFVSFEVGARALMASEKTSPDIAAAQPRNIEAQRHDLCYYAAEEAATAVTRGRPPASRPTMVRPPASQPTDE